MVALCALYRDDGFRSAAFQTVAFVAQGADFCVADLAWTIDRTAKPPSRFRTGYNLVRGLDGWRVLLCTAYSETKLARSTTAAASDGGMASRGAKADRRRPLPERIDTARLHLRPSRLEDAGAIFRSYAQDTEVCRFMVWSPHASEDETRAFVASCVDAWRTGERLAYVIAEHGDDEPIGMIEARIVGATVDIGYVLARSKWGRGAMPEAIRAIAGAALAEPAIFRCQATCDIDDTASQRALEKAGFAREGRLERCTVHANVSPEPRPCFMYAACR